MVCRFLINRDSFFSFRPKKQLIDLPVEIWIRILRLIAIEELKKLWSQELVLNSKLAYVIGYLLTHGDIHIYKVSSRYWSYFEPPLLKTLLAAKEYFNILRLGKRNGFGFFPRSLMVIFFLFTRKCYIKLQRFIKLIYSCLDTENLNSEIVLVIGSLKPSQLKFDFVNRFQRVYQLNLYKFYANINIKGNINITELVLEVGNQENITHYPQQLKYLRISPKSNINEKDINVSLKRLPTSLVNLKLDNNINLLDSGRVLPSLEYFECRDHHVKNYAEVYGFLLKNSLRLKYIHLEYNSLAEYDFNRFKELRILSLVKCLNIPFDSFNSLVKLKRLSLSGCDISPIYNMNFPPQLREIFIAPGNRDILQGLEIPTSLKSITIVDVENI